MKNPTEKDVQSFMKLYNEFYNKCLDKNLFPSPSLRMGPKGIYPFIDIAVINEKEKKELLKNLQNI